MLAAGLGVAWQVRLSEQAVLGGTTQSTDAVPQAAPSPAPNATPPAATPPAAQTPQPAPPAVAVPTFDIARIGPDGRAVVAGRANPGAKIVLLDGGKEIARSEADARGEWVVIAQDPPLSAGQHELRVVQHIEGRAPVTSEQVVVAVVPEQPAASAAPPGVAGNPPREETLVMIAPPGGGPAKLVQAPSAAGVPRSGDLAMSTLDYDDAGHVTVTGQATPGVVVRVYINDNMVAEGAAGSDGRWKLQPPDPIGPGKHTLRLDRLASDGKPMARLELPFERVVVPPGTKDTRRLVVVRGDNLWNIARAHYGQGFHHTVIYGANKEQIRNPDLIYPGQVFSLPKVN
ncbi:MAG: LysM peptidoglycan-binding domain-containing protein [Rhodospirillales bacterium]|nr:LysM peptidoglycan-binding domain-containing protein [Rhodospirillales bacterium]